MFAELLFFFLAFFRPLQVKLSIKDNNEHRKSKIKICFYILYIIIRFMKD